MTPPILAMKWQHADAIGRELIEQLDQQLDHRKKGLSDPDTNRRVLAAFIAYRGGPFQVLMGNLHPNDKDPVRDALEGLKGNVLLSCKDKNTYQFRDDFAYLRVGGKVRTLTATHTELETTWGAIYRDGTHSEVPFSSFPRFGYARPSLVRIVAPHRHWQIFFADQPAPSKNWQEMEETTRAAGTLEGTNAERLAADQHEKIMEAVVHNAWRSGVKFIRYGEDSFICQNPEQAAFHLDNTLLRLTGKVGSRPLLEVTDAFQRKSLRWGSKP